MRYLMEKLEETLTVAWFADHRLATTRCVSQENAVWVQQLAMHFGGCGRKWICGYSSHCLHNIRTGKCQDRRRYFDRSLVWRLHIEGGFD